MTNDTLTVELPDEVLAALQRIFSNRCQGYDVDTVRKWLKVVNTKSAAAAVDRMRGRNP